MVKRNSKGNVDWPGMVETSQPDVPANATRVQNPLGMVSEAPPGTIYTDADGGMGGDGCQYNWPPMSSGEKWNNNPLRKPPNGFIDAPVLSVVVKKRK